MIKTAKISRVRVPLTKPGISRGGGGWGRLYCTEIHERIKVGGQEPLLLSKSIFPLRKRYQISTPFSPFAFNSRLTSIIPLSLLFLIFSFKFSPFSPHSLYIFPPKTKFFLIYTRTRISRQCHRCRMWNITSIRR